MSENVSENVREPQVLDTIGKGGNYWRITEIDEKGSITAWRIYDGKIYKKGRPLRINVEKIKDGTFRLLDIPPVTVSHIEPEKYEPQKVVPAPERCEEPEEKQERVYYARDTWEEPEPPTTLLTEDFRDVRLRLEDRIEELEIGLDKALKELDNVTRDRDMLKAQLKIVEQEKAKAEGHAAGLMTAMNLLIHGQGAKG